MFKMIVLFLIYITVVHSQDTVLTKVDDFVERLMTETNTQGPPFQHSPSFNAELEHHHYNVFSIKWAA